MIPSLVAFELKRALTEYLSTTYAIGDEVTREALAEFLTDPKDGIFRGPYVHIRSPYRRAPDTWKSPLEWFPDGFLPFTHQALAWDRLSSYHHQPEPTIVRTGTGSGKTEAFLLPILDHCQRAAAAGQRGVKALLLYPMNALASDQAGRLAALIESDPRLNGVRAGIYIGDDRGSAGGKHLSVKDGSLIDNRAELRANPPDILLTNYKMLDFMLLREEDRELWAENGPTTLQYVVVDELHSYDGAQGTDVAMLLRRLGARLDMSTDGQALGAACPVATSATLGAGSAANAALAEFASRLFGRTITTDAIVSDDRLSPAEACKPVNYDHPIPEPGDLPDDIADDLELMAAAFLGGALADEVGKDPRVALGEKLLEHTLTRAFVEAASDQPREWSDAVERIVVRAPSWGRWLRRDKDRLHAAVADYLALLSIARRETSVGIEPLFNVQVQLWVREVSRLDRQVVAKPVFQWNDRGTSGAGSSGLDSANVEPIQPTLPAVYCRHCGRTGWATLFQEVDGCMSASGSDIRRGALDRSARLRMMISATPGEVEAQWYDPFARQLVGPAVLGGQPAKSSLVCVLTTASDAAGKSQECPSCGADDAIRFLGTQIASLASVAIGEIFGSTRVEVEERKLLAFADSVQDAAHRASFFSARTYRFNIRTLMAAIVRSHDGGVRLDSLGDQLLAEAEGRSLNVVFGVVPPDLERDKLIRTLWTEKPDPLGRTLLQRRLSFEAVLEFGLLARVGRTLELTSSAAAQVIIADPERLAAAAFESIRLGVTSPPLDLEHRLGLYLRGLTERFRMRGAIFHPLLDSYIAADGASYRLWGGRPPGAPVFTDRQSRPAFFTDANRPSGFDPIGASKGRTWLVDWAMRSLGVLPADAPEVNLRAIAALESFRVVQSRRSSTGALVYGLEASNVMVFDVPSVNEHESELEPERSILCCDVCSHRFAVPPVSLGGWIDSPCLKFRCTGTYGVARVVLASTYRRMYRSGETRRVVAAEHTGQLSRTDREAVEAAFKHGGGPDAPNVLTCTPTLEMGIDIGDLSAVMLTSVPRGGAASYVQRVGRAGRKTGNALVATFAGSDPASLYFLDNPLRMIDGEIRPPACHLDSVEIMSRQFLAFMLDCAASHRIMAPAMPRDIVDVLGKNALNAATLSWIGSCVEASRLDPSFVGQFLALFGAHISAEVRAALEDFAAGGLEIALKTSAARWQEELADLERRRERLTARIKTIDANVAREPEEDDDLRALRGERKVIGARITAHRGEYTLSALERFGLLPSYTLSDASTELDAVLWSIDDDGDRTPQQTSFKRPSKHAIREFAPGNSYYAQGHRFVIDALDVGTGNEPLYETWRLCPDCGYGATDTSNTWTLCPRCSSVKIADLGAQHKLLRLTRVLCIDNEEKARVFDERDERDRERYDNLVTVDIDTSYVVKAFSLTNATFGAELARGARIRMLNLGATERPGAATVVAGQAFNASKFTTCVHCGIVQGARPVGLSNTVRHLGWCRTRSGTTEKWENLVLSHQLTTDAIRMLVPVASVEAADRLATFKAVIRLGLRASFGGDPDHVEVVTSDMPASPGQSGHIGKARRNFVVLYDTVPGGSGYLDRLADPERLRAIFENARELISTCMCTDEGLQACHRCLLGVADRNEIPLVTRVLALEQIDDLLREWDAEPVATVAALGIDQLEESELERLFRASLVAWDARRDDVMISEAPGGRHNGFELRIGVKQGSTPEPVRWRIREQMDINALGTTCRPDFVFTRVDGPPIEIAVFTDGERFHASPETNRLADDARKRQALLDSGRLVWNLTWVDVKAFHDAYTASSPKVPAPNGLLEKDQVELAARPLASIGGRLSATLGMANALEQLLAFLTDPDLGEWEKLACAVVSTRLSGSTTLHPLDAVGDLVERALIGDGTMPASEVSVAGLAVGTFDTISAFLDLANDGPKKHRWTVINVMNDGALGTSVASAQWRQWLAWANLGQFLRSEDRQFFFNVSSNAASFDRGQLHILSGVATPVVHVVAAQITLDPLDLGLVEKQLRTLLEVSVETGLSVVPEYGYEPDDPKQRGWQLDVAWPSARIAAVSEEDSERDEWLKGEGWVVRLATGWTADEVVALATRKIEHKDA
jgi:replicative superfamily II helicase